MPKKKTGARKKAEKQRIRQKEIRLAGEGKSIVDWPCNYIMECEKCKRKQKNRAACYFCANVQKTIVCGHCGKMKCMMKSGDCVVKHPGQYTTGMGMVGAICDFCEAFICHGRKCLSTHACECPLADADCIECERDVWSHGGRLFKCSFCNGFLCEDDQFEHQASCQTLEGESYKCGSCNKLGQFSCLKCKSCYCDDHVRRKGFKYVRGDPLTCPKCSFQLQNTKDLSMSVKKFTYGRQQHDDDDDDDSGGAGGYAAYWENQGAGAGFSGFGMGAAYYNRDDDDDDDDDDSDDDEDDDDDEESDGSEENKEKFSDVFSGLKLNPVYADG
ncbi:hypothetical protein BSL78_19662 [Apostichopus japonicus]|uniref:Zinc finger protein n=1 Tax=Stichopus japonicus TaxID=307972 RepID=A0A2G8K653_STIJA|nr:hypothetical protein BSL78_19662 [Apostichopus japonicus]